MGIFSSKTVLFGVLVPALLASPAAVPLAFAAPNAPASDTSHSTGAAAGESSSAAVITALGALGLVFTFAGSHGSGGAAPAALHVNAIIAGQPPMAAPAAILSPSLRSPSQPFANAALVSVAAPRTTVAVNTETSARGGVTPPLTTDFFFGLPGPTGIGSIVAPEMTANEGMTGPETTSDSPDTAGSDSVTFTLPLPQNAGPNRPLDPSVLFATPEPSTLAAFGCTGLFVGGLMLCARRRDAA